MKHLFVSAYDKYGAALAAPYYFVSSTVRNPSCNSQFRCYNKVMQIWFIGRTLASQAGKAGSTPVICYNHNNFKIIIKELKTIDFTWFPALFDFKINQNVCFLIIKILKNFVMKFVMTSPKKSLEHNPLQVVTSFLLHLCFFILHCMLVNTI